MSNWTVDFANDPYNDYEMIVQILYNDEDITVIHHGKDGLELKWYAHQNDLVVPLEWIADLFTEAKKRLGSK